MRRNLGHDLLVKGFSLFTFLFVVLSLAGSLGSSQISNRVSIEFVIDTNTSHLQPHFHHTGLTKNPIEFPADSEPFLVEKDEKEDFDNQEWTKNSSGVQPEFEHYSDQHSRSLVQFEQQVLNRSKRSLILLYHCWKHQLT